MAVENVHAGLDEAGVAYLMQVILSHPNVTADVGGLPARIVAEQRGAKLDIAVAGWGEVFGRFEITVKKVD